MSSNRLEGSVVEEWSGRNNRGLEILRQAAVSIDPLKEVFDHPLGRENGESCLTGDFTDDFDDDAPGCRDLIVVVPPIVLGTRNERIQGVGGVQERLAAAVILHAPRLRFEDERPSVRIHQGMTFSFTKSRNSIRLRRCIDGR